MAASFVARAAADKQILLITPINLANDG